MEKIVEVWVDSGIVIERDPTDDEMMQAEKDAAAYKNAQEEIAEKAASLSAATNAAIQHAKSLGFTDQMISVLYPTLVEK